MGDGEESTSTTTGFEEGASMGFSTMGVGCFGGEDTGEETAHGGWLVVGMNRLGGRRFMLSGFIGKLYLCGNGKFIFLTPWSNEEAVRGIRLPNTIQKKLTNYN